MHKRPFGPKPPYTGVQRHEDGQSEIHALGKVETAAAATLQFLIAFCATAIRITLKPTRWHLPPSKAASASRFTAPYSFLIVSTFLATSGLRALTSALLLLSLSLATYCTPETQLPTTLPEPREVLVLPSAGDMVVLGIPVALLTICIAFLLSRVFQKFDSRRRPLRSDLIYILAYQQILLMLAIVIGVFQALYHSRTVFQIDPLVVFAVMSALEAGFPFNQFGLLLLVVVGWPAALLSIRLSLMLPGSPLRKALLQLVIAPLSVAATTFALIGSIAIALTSAWMWTEHQLTQKPLLSAVSITAHPDQHSILLTNNSKVEVALMLDSVSIQELTDGARFEKFEVSSLEERAGRSVLLSPARSVWLDLKRSKGKRVKDLCTYEEDFWVPWPVDFENKFNQMDPDERMPRSMKVLLLFWKFVGVLPYKAPEGAKARLCFERAALPNPSRQVAVFLRAAD